MTRRERLYPVIAELREQGLTFKQIGARLGISLKAAHDYYTDPTGDKARARKLKNARPCLDCGKLVNVDGRRTNPAERCVQCNNDRRKIWTRDALILAIQEWADDNGGVPPVATDWNPAHARAVGRPDKAARFERDGHWPQVYTVQRVFGSWNAAIREAGFEPHRPGTYGRPGEDSEVIASTAARYLAGSSSSEIARQDGVSVECVRYRLRKADVELRQPHTYGEHTRRRAARMYADGMTAGDVAATLGVCSNSVLAWAREFGVQVRPAGRRRDSMRTAA
jgi:hypothetical protein